MKKILFTTIGILFVTALLGQDIVREFQVESQYLNIPVDMEQDRQMVQFVVNKDTLTHSVIRVADGEPDYWVFKDVSDWQGEDFKLIFSKQVKGIEQIYQADRFAGQDSQYRETNRPQFHFSSRRGWNNDPNGLVYYDGEYHLFYQHNPYEIYWGNMHWGHAVSKDLVHWRELDDALYPGPLGTMFSGSAVIDKNNTSGWGKNALVAAYTADNTETKRQTQCMAYSTDKGRSFTKYKNNPVIPSENRNTRDPKVFWYEPKSEWVMALYEEAGITIYTSKNLKDWNYESRVNGFHECPELFELPVDGDPDNTLWVLYGGSGAYMLGDFNGKTYEPMVGKYQTISGNQYASQTYNNTPDGKRIQIGWGRIEAKGMPFNQMMTFPTELTLRTTNEGVRLFCEPIDAIKKLHDREYDLSGLSIARANETLSNINHDLLHVKARMESLNGSTISLHYNGNRCVNLYTDEVPPFKDPGKLIYDVEMLIDRTSLEVYLQNGRSVKVIPLSEPKNNNGLKINGNQKYTKIHHFKVFELNSAW